MKRRTGAVLVVLLLTSAWLDVQAVGGWASGANAKRTRRSPRAARTRARTAGAACPGAFARPTRANAQALAATMVCLIDRERARFGAGPLHVNPDLGAIAAEQAHDMVVGGYFGDKSLTGRTPLQRVKASRYGSHNHGLSLGQDIGWGTGVLATPEAMVRGWMRSPAHRRITLTREYLDVGAGIAPAIPRKGRRAAHGATYVVDLVGHSG